MLVAGVPPDATSPEIWQAHESLKPAAPLHGRRPRGRADRAHRVYQAHGSRRRTRCELAARGSRRPAASLLGRSQPLDRCGAPNSRVHHCRQRDQPLSRTDRSDPRRLLERHLWRRPDEAAGLRPAGAGPPGGQPGVSTSRWPACWIFEVRRPKGSAATPRWMPSTARDRLDRPDRRLSHPAPRLAPTGGWPGDDAGSALGVAEPFIGIACSTGGPAGVNLHMKVRIGVCRVAGTADVTHRPSGPDPATLGNAGRIVVHVAIEVVAAVIAADSQGMPAAGRVHPGGDGARLDGHHLLSPSGHHVHTLVATAPTSPGESVVVLVAHRANHRKPIKSVDGVGGCDRRVRRSDASGGAKRHRNNKSGCNRAHARRQVGETGRQVHDHVTTTDGGQAPAHGSIVTSSSQSPAYRHNGGLTDTQPSYKAGWRSGGQGVTPARAGRAAA